MKKSLLAFLVASAFISSASAFSSFVVKDIRIEGIQRTEAGTVFSYLPVKVGDTLTDEKAAQSIKALFATGFFKDVRVEIEDDVLVVVVQERPAITQISFSGMKEFEKDVILKALKETGIAEGRIFDRSLLERAEQELKRQYLSKGKYSVVITTTITPLERNRVAISFNIDEGVSAKIKQINIVGAKEFKESELLKQFDLTTPGFFTWYSKNDQYSRQKLSADLEKLKSFYMNQGFLEFAIDSTQVTISPDKEDVFISVNIKEGNRFQISGVKLVGDFSIPEAELRQLIKIKPGEPFSRENLNDSTKAISDRLGKEGFAFANVNAAPEIDKEKNQVSFTIFVDPGKRVYVRRINIVGNTKTRDDVIRRELRQMESAWFDADKVANSKQRIDRLGYFQDVSMETPAVPGTADLVDLDIKVTEKPTGSLMLGVGVSSTDKLILSGAINQTNFLGSGNTVGIQVNSGRVNKTYSFSYTNPYFTQDGISQGFDVYRRDIDTSSLNTVGVYKSSSLGAGLRYGFPIGDKESIGIGLAVDSTKITTFSDSPQRYINFVRDFGATNLAFPVTLSWTSDGKDSYYFPTMGRVHKATFEVAVPGGDLTYYKANYQLQQYFPITKSFTLALLGEAGYANGYGGDGLPFYKNFYAGGIGSVRGYKTSSLGPTDINDYDGSTYRTGGNRRVLGSAELLWSVSGTDKSFRMGWFVDAGQVYGAGQSVDLGTVRYSTGLSAAWMSPVGPLKFSLGYPINKRDGDKSEPFQFQMGTTF